MTWEGLQARQPKTDWVYSVTLDRRSKYTILTRIEECMGINDLFCTLQTVVSVYLGMPILSGVSCSQVIALILGRPEWREYTKPELLLEYLSITRPIQLKTREGTTYELHRKLGNNNAKAHGCGT